MKILLYSLVLLLCASNQTMAGPSGSATVMQIQSPGDVNSDGTIHVFDALLTLQYAVGLYHPATETSFRALADVAPLRTFGAPVGDSLVNVFDALDILRHAVGLDSWFQPKTAAKTMGTSGGTLTLTLTDGTGFELVVPSGALSADTTLSLTTQAPVPGQRFNLVLKPAGMILAGGVCGHNRIE